MSDPEDPELAALRARKLAELRESAAKPAWPEGVLTLTDDSLPGAVASFPSLVVDCWAVWCAPCRYVAPIVEALASELRGRVAFGKLDVDENPRTSAAFAVSSIPTLLFFRDGRLADRLVGALPKAQIDLAIRRAFRAGSPGPRRA